MSSLNVLKIYENQDIIEVGLDEAGRGCLIGRVYAAAVIFPKKFDDDIYLQIKDSKKLSANKRYKLKDYIEENAIAFGVGYCDADYIDEHNIYNSTMKAMHNALDQLNINVELLLVDGPSFKPYLDKEDNYVDYKCYNKGDNTYLSIAAASILAKCYHDSYIKQLVQDNDYLNKYDLLNNKGYGTKKHLDSIKEYGISKFHRKSFKPCTNTR